MTMTEKFFQFAKKVCQLIHLFLQPQALSAKSWRGDAGATPLIQKLYILISVGAFCGVRTIWDSSQRLSGAFLNNKKNEQRRNNLHCPLGLLEKLTPLYIRWESCLSPPEKHGKSSFVC